MGCMLIHPKFPLTGALIGFSVGTIIWACTGFADGKEYIPGIATIIGFVWGNIAGRSMGAWGHSTSGDELANIALSGIILCSSGHCTVSVHSDRQVHVPGPDK